MFKKGTAIAVTGGPGSARIGLSAIATATALLTLTGCAVGTGDALTQVRPSYSTVGPVSEIAQKDRAEPVVFSGTLENGDTASSADWVGKVVVVNFWYAGCAPCRAEAPDLAALDTEFRDQGVMFVGVNVRDQAGTAQSFASTFNIAYPSFLDVNDGSIQLAFSGTIAPNAVPTTVVLDREGRVASRIVGRLASRSILETLLRDTLAESP